MSITLKKSENIRNITDSEVSGIAKKSKGFYAAGGVLFAVGMIFGLLALIQWLYFRDYTMVPEIVGVRFPKVMSGLFNYKSGGGLSSLLLPLSVAIFLISAGLGVAKNSIMPIITGIMMSSVFYYGPMVINELSGVQNGNGNEKAPFSKLLSKQENHTGILNMSKSRFKHANPVSLSSYSGLISQKDKADWFMALDSEFVLHHETASRTFKPDVLKLDKLTNNGKQSVNGYSSNPEARVLAVLNKDAGISSTAYNQISERYRLQKSQGLSDSQENLLFALYSGLMAALLLYIGRHLSKRTKRAWDYLRNMSRLDDVASA